VGVVVRVDGFGFDVDLGTIRRMVDDARGVPLGRLFGRWFLVRQGART